ncbi:MAG: hypothetical protein FWE74_03845 [Oscillospiraceae bacterium]|nr:hypothetical protein [Oscillospiraceae bacterium]
MSDIIRNLFNGQINPSSNDYFYLFDDGFDSAEKELRETFNDNQKQLFKAYKAARCIYENEIAFNNFECGYKTASKLIFDGLH